jgi:hypothetical protein
MAEQYESHKCTEECDVMHSCTRCKYEHLDEDTEQPCYDCFNLDRCYFVPKQKGAEQDD